MEPRQSSSHRAVTDLVTRQHARELAGLGLAVAVMDLEAERLLERSDHLRVQRFTRGDEPAQLRGVETLERQALRDHAVLGRRLAEDADTFLRDERDPL